MKRIVFGIADRAREGAAAICVARDATDLETVQPGYFLTPHPIAYLADDLRAGMLQKRGVTVETRHRSLRIRLRLLCDKLEILRKRPEKTFRRQ
jgi:hypothetical protein